MMAITSPVTDKSPARGALAGLARHAASAMIAMGRTVMGRTLTRPWAALLERVSELCAHAPVWARLAEADERVGLQLDVRREALRVEQRHLGDLAAALDDRRTIVVRETGARRPPPAPRAPPERPGCRP